MGRNCSYSGVRGQRDPALVAQYAADWMAGKVERLKDFSSSLAPKATPQAPPNVIPFRSDKRDAA